MVSLTEKQHSEKLEIKNGIYPQIKISSKMLKYWNKAEKKVSFWAAHLFIKQRKPFNNVELI